MCKEVAADEQLFHRDFMFRAKSEGGLGLMNPHALCAAKHLSFKLSVLNCDDDQLQETARASLNLQMNKRKVPAAPLEAENTFAGSESNEEGRMLKKSKVNRSNSDWIQMNELSDWEKVRLGEKKEEKPPQQQQTNKTPLQMTTSA